jgi:prepilin-type N-terminal cleavage/methylation domain-containing protein
MLQKYKDKREEGFTIIEVLIVLAIAGLIIIIVFLAVPALQRNSRNTQRRNDVQAVLGSFQEFANNNNGQLPADPAAGVANANLGFYAAADFTGALNASAAAATVTSNGNGVVIKILLNARRPYRQQAHAAVITNTGGPTRRNVVAVFQVETRGNFQTQCLDM